MEKQTLGSVIACLRKEQGMTQAELGEKMNVTDKAVSKWERDLSCPDINSVPKLAEVLHVSVDELMQVKARGQAVDKKSKVDGIIGMVIKAIALAMGVAVTVLSIVKELDAQAAFTMLGIGLTCAGISLLRQQDHTAD